MLQQLIDGVHEYSPQKIRKPLLHPVEVMNNISPIELFNADPNCEHNVVCAPCGGVKCTKCSGWFRLVLFLIQNKFAKEKG